MLPLLFILVLEVLNGGIRSDEQIKGLKVKQEQFKLRAFAGDLVLILQDPLETAEHLIKKLKEFGSLAGLKVNKQKTKMLIKNMTPPDQDLLMSKTGFQIEKKVRYLGVILSIKNSMLFKNNYVNIWKDVKMICKDEENYNCLSWEEYL